MPKSSHRFQVRAVAADRAELILYGEVDRFWGVGAKQVRDELKALGTAIQTLDVHINSEGGNYFEGVAIYNVLRNHPARVVVHVDGMALSIASLIAMAGDERLMADGAYMMVHNPIMAAFGDAADHEQTAELLKDVTEQLTAIYARHTGLSDEEIVALMAAETWLDAGEAVAKGFATGTEASLAVAANFHVKRFQNVPESLCKSTEPRKQEPANMADTNSAPAAPAEPTTAPAPQPAAFADLKAALPEADAGFMVAQLDAKATVDQAKAAWTKHLADQLKAKEDELAKVLAEKPQPPAEPSGVPPLSSASGSAGSGVIENAGEEFERLVAEQMKAGTPRHKAVQNVARRNPDLRAAWLEQVNAR
jgi:ATP-dependent protease ClpP protease subunit